MNPQSDSLSWDAALDNTPNIGTASFKYSYDVFELGEESLFELTEELRCNIGIKNKDRLPMARTEDVFNWIRDYFGWSTKCGDVDKIIHDISAIIFPVKFRDMLDEIEILTILPIKNMASLPVAMLRPLGDKSRTIDNFAVRFMPFVSDLFKSTQFWPRTWNKTLIVGNPHPLNDPVWDFPPLPYAGIEAKSAAKRFDTEAYTRTAAVKSVVVAQASDAEYIHIASHALSDDHRVLDESFIALREGRWTAREIQSLELKKDPLVILSACQTGLGFTMDAGVVGLARAFHIAGAGQTLMSLWNIHDESAHILMQEFTSRLDRYPPAKAVRLAQISVRRNWPNPIHWAAFNLYESRVVSEFKSKNQMPAYSWELDLR